MYRLPVGATWRRPIDTYTTGAFKWLLTTGASSDLSTIPESSQLLHH